MIHNIPAQKFIPIMDLNWQDMVGSPLDEFYTAQNTVHKQLFDWCPNYIREFAEE